MTTRQRTTADQYEKEQAAEWTTYVARVPIDYYGQRAFNVGDPVPASAVGEDPGAGRWVSPQFVDKRADPFTGSTTVAGSEPPTIDPAAVAAPPVSSPDPTGITTTEG
jgi:hypothetical protein